MAATRNLPPRVWKLRKPRFWTASPSKANSAHTEIFGPVLTWFTRRIWTKRCPSSTRIPSQSASLFTRAVLRARFPMKGRRKHRHQHRRSRTHVTYFPFHGWNDRFFGDMHGPRDATPSSSTPTRKSSSNACAEEHSRKFMNLYRASGSFEFLNVTQ